MKICTIFSAPDQIFSIITFFNRILRADIYPIVCRQLRHVRVAFREESDGLRQGKEGESKGEEKTRFFFPFCPLHNGLCKPNEVNLGALIFK